MKKIVLKVEVPDDYVLNDPSWLLENIGMMLNVFNLFENTNPYKLHVGFSQILLATSR